MSLWLPQIKAQLRLLLAGSKVSRLLPFMKAHGFHADATTRGHEVLELMRAAARQLIIVELELDDMLVGDLLRAVRAEGLEGSLILMDDPAKTGSIVSALAQGADGYVATPPDEPTLFRVIERQLLAQWALSQVARRSSDAQVKSRLDQALQLERARVGDLTRELALLRGELKLRGPLGEAAPPGPPLPRLEDEFDDGELTAADLADSDEELAHAVTRQLLATPLATPLSTARELTRPAPVGFGEAARGGAPSDAGASPVEDDHGPLLEPEEPTTINDIDIIRHKRRGSGTDDRRAPDDD